MSSNGPAYYTAQISLALNEDWIVPFVFTNADGTPIDLTDSVLRLQFRNTDTDTHAVVSLSSDSNGIVITDATNGAFTVVIARGNQLLRANSSYVCDLVRLNTNNEIQDRLFAGVANVTLGVTR